MPVFRARRWALALVSLAVVLTLPLVANSATAQPQGPGPTVTLLQQEGSLGVDCGPLPAGAKAFEVNYRAADQRSRTTRLPDGATSTAISVTLGVAYAITCRTRYGGFWGPRSAPTSARYPDLTLPVLRVDTTGSAPVDTRETYVGAQVTLDPNGSSVPALASTGARIRGRGNTTWTAPTDKKPYKLRLDRAVSLLGMPAFRDWALLANYYDRTMLRQALAYQWGTASSLAWTPRTRFVELVLNGDYRGVYQVSETVDVAPDRVAIDKASGADPAGGYLAEIDWRPQTSEAQPGDVTHFWASYSGTPVTIKDPDSPSSDQISALHAVFDAAEIDIYQASQGDAEAWRRLQDHLDLRSFADWYVVSEMARNHDVWFSSTYLFLPRNGKLTMGPLWDFDLSMGSYFFSAEPADDPWVRQHSPWFDYLLRIPAFESLVRSRYVDLREAIGAHDGTLSTLNAEIAAARSNDAIRWNYGDDLSQQVATLRRWLAARQQWFDSVYG